MTLLIDARPLVALAAAGEPQRDAILAAISDEPASLVIPAPTTAEVDYLLGQRRGDPARRASLTVDRDKLARFAAVPEYARNSQERSSQPQIGFSSGPSSIKTGRDWP